MLRTIALLAGAASVHAHIAMWDAGMFGLNYPGQATDANQNYNNNQPVLPLREMDALSLPQWFGHGLLSYPPAPGEFMTLPAGGVYTGEQQCNRGQTSLGDPNVVATQALPYYACGGIGALHVMNTFGQAPNNIWFGGTALAIAYTSNVATVQPNDFTVISVNATQVWTREVEYQIPANLPACPAGGCLCTWNWYHEGNHGEGYPYEMYNVMYRCQVTGSTSSAVVQRGAVPVDCTNNAAACVSGPKTPIYMYQLDGNNVAHSDTPPSYNPFYGFQDGAQNDIFGVAATPAPTTYLDNPYATPTTSVSGYNRPTPSATALPQGWVNVGCNVDSNTRAVGPGANTNMNSNSWAGCVAYCSGQGYTYAGVEYGNECWCGNQVILNATNQSDCNVPCAGDPYAMCGGSWRVNIFMFVYTPPTSTTPTVQPTSTLSTTLSSSTTTAQTATASPATSTTKSGKFTYTPMGCMTDAQPRLLGGANTQSSLVTPDWCTSYCGGLGYAYAGTEYGNECWCGNSVGSQPAAQNCNVQCAGDATQICGGSWALNVFSIAPVGSQQTSSVSTTSTSTSSTTSTTSTTTTSTSSTSTSSTSTTSSAPVASQTSHSGLYQYSSVGCILDSATRTLPGATITTNVMTNDYCVNYCGGLGYAFAGTENHYQCFCGNALGTTTASQNCYNSCDGDNTQTCGGPWALTVWAISPVPKQTTTSTTAPATTSSAGTWTGTYAFGTYTGGQCYVDSPSRVLTGPWQNMRPIDAKICVTWCASQGYSYAGTEYDQQCFCGNSLSTPLTLGNNCNMPCSNNQTQMCGGPWAVTVYSIQPSQPSNFLPSGWKPMGCVVDQPVRTLNGGFGQSQSVTPSECALACQASGFTWAGTENTYQCFCGNSMTAASAINCNMPCIGDPTKTCGGAWALNVYQFTGSMKRSRSRRSQERGLITIGVN